MATVREVVRRIVSGGQTGVDRGALDAAISLGIEHGGWCPRGRLAEDGSIPPDYQLVETSSREYRVRTEQNVIDSDGTLILARGSLQGGTQLTKRLAEKHGKPLIVVDPTNASSTDAVAAWIVRHEVHVLNVAGPRESSDSGIGHAACDFIRELCTNRS